MIEDWQIDWIVLGLATACNCLMGALWYSRWLFGPQWKAIAKPKGDPGVLAWVGVVFFSFVIVFFQAFFQAYLGITTVSDGMFVGFCFWLGFAVPVQIGPVLWKVSPLSLFWIDAGYRCLSFVVVGGLLGA